MLPMILSPSMSKHLIPALAFSLGMVVIPLGFMVGFSELGLDHGLGLLVGTFTFGAGTVAWWQRKRRLDEIVLERFRKPILDAIEQGPAMDGAELKYHKDLVRHFLATVEVHALREQSLPTGTKVDAAMEFGGADWYITVKRGLTNQQRLTLQGEIEDILLHAPRRGREIWIVVVVGVEEDPAAPTWSQLRHLLHYTVMRLGERDGVTIEIVPVPRSSPLVAEHDQLA